MGFVTRLKTLYRRPWFVPILIGVLLAVVGLALVFASSQGSLGQKLLGSALVAFAFGWLGRRQEVTAERQRLQLMLGLQEDLTGVSLAKADLSGFYLHGKTLTEADLAGANLTEANLFEVNLAKANLLGANLFEAHLAGADLTQANLTRADLAGAVLFGADLTQALLFKTNFTGARLAGANFAGANLSEANLAGADLPLARADSRTLWPDSFDPRAAGVIFVDGSGPGGDQTDGNARAPVSLEAAVSENRVAFRRDDAGIAATDPIEYRAQVRRDQLARLAALSGSALWSRGAFTAEFGEAIHVCDPEPVIFGDHNAAGRCPHCHGEQFTRERYMTDRPGVCAVFWWCEGCGLGRPVQEGAV